MDGGFAAVCFFSGLEMPMLMSMNFTPLRNVSITLIVLVLPTCSLRSIRFSSFAAPSDPAYFFSGVAVNTGVAGDASPLKIVTAAGGSGLSALASSRLTCHISVSDNISL